MSPTATAVRTTLLHQPPVAVVHLPATQKRVPSNSRGYSTAAAAKMVLAVPTPQANPGSGAVVRRRLPGSTGEGYASQPQLVVLPQALLDGDSVRLLSEDEVRQRSKKAVDFFRSTREINRRARTVEDMESTLAEVRRRKTLEDVNKPALPSPKEQEEVKGLNLLKNISQPEPEVVQELQAAVEEEPAKPKSLIERMGYGVKPKSKWGKLKLVVKAQVAFKKNAGEFVGVQAGQNDLLERLAAKRNLTIE